MQHFEYKLEPTNSDVDSKIIVTFSEDRIRMMLFDCDKHITWRFKDIRSIKKLERIRVALDMIENELKNRELNNRSENNRES